MKTPPGSQPALIPMHIGRYQPGSKGDRVLRHPLMEGIAKPRPLPDADWAAHGVEPRWIGMDTTDCAATIDPNLTNHGLDDLNRCFAGAATRGEVALVIATLGNPNEPPSPPLRRGDDSLSLPQLKGTIYGRRLPTGIRAELAPGLDNAERDLARRLTARAPDAPWWALTLKDLRLQRFGSDRFDVHRAQGTLRPVLVDGLGAPIAGVWTPDKTERWYIVPSDTDWNSLTDWIVNHALPAYVPGALRRARIGLTDVAELRTDAEANAVAELEAMRARYAQEEAALQAALQAAREAAEPIRYGLLYGTGTPLAEAVAAVFRGAGMEVVDLDQKLGEPVSADLLVIWQGQRRLVEVKSAGGNAREDLVAPLRRHLATWPHLTLGADTPVGGGVLVVNHQHRMEPADRTRTVFQRPEFVASLDVAVLSTVVLFDWWRRSDWEAIRAAVIGGDPAPATTGEPAPPRQGWLRRWR